MNLREAAQMALNALEETGTCPKDWPLQYEKEEKAIAALRAALAEPEQEPVAWLYRDAWGTMKLSQTLPPPVGAFPVYTALTPRKPLHDMAVFDLADEHLYEGGKNYGILAFARAIEKAHGIGDQT